MMKKSKLYIDEEGVKRGYYVYLHKATETGEVFYVGKGSGGRAWETERRNNAWKEKVEQLDEKWEVEIYEGDLTEIEAFNIEEELVEKYGFFDDQNEQLTNHIPGGEHPASISISLGKNEISEWQKVYYEKRKFNSVNKEEKTVIATKVHEKLESIYWKLNEIDNQTDDFDDESDHTAFMLICAFEDPMVDAEEFLKSRISWKDFCLGLEESHDYFQDQYGNEKINEEEFSDEVYKLFLESRAIVTQAFQKIDSGNKQEAIRLANQAATNIPTDISSQIPNQASAIEVLSIEEADNFFDHICQIITLNGFKIKNQDSDDLTLETEFVELGDDLKLQIKVSVENTKKNSKAIFIGRAKSESLSKLFAKRGKSELSFKSKWCKTKYPRLSFGQIAALATQEIAHEEINYLCQN
jgi:hypothetical protein